MKRQSTRQKQQQNNNSTTQHSRGTTVAPSRRQRARRPRVPLAPLSLSSLLLLTLNLTLMMFSKTTTTVVRGFPLSSLPTRTTAKTTSVARRTTALSLFGATTASASSSSRRRVVTGSLADRRRSTRLRDTTSDQSSTAKSRAPFRQPKSAPDDSRPANQHNANSNAATTWTDLGVWPDVSNCLKKEMKLSAPTVVQQLVVPRLLDPTNDNSNSEGETTASSSRHVAFLAATGSGKTLAYALPVMQQLKREELEAQAAAAAESAIATNLLPKPRLHGRPRALILAPTRELCLQITTVLKQLGHTIKLSVQCVTGGDTSLGQQAKALKNKPIDVLVATPGRLRKHVEGSGGAQSVLLLSSKHLQYVVLDEMDTMLEQGFADDLAHLLYPVLYHKKYPGSNAKQNSGTLIDPNRDVVDVAPTVLLTSATLTQSIQRMLGETDKQNLVQAKRHFVRPETEAELLARSKEGHMPMRNHHNNNNASPMVLPRMTVLKAPGLHKTVPRLSQVFVDVANVDKLSLLVDVISSNRQQQPNKRPTTTMVFCNTAASCRAAEFALEEARLECLSYHGELKSTLRSDNWQSFCRNDCPILVCTDLAARGLDVPAVNHVILFDFPLNALDYLHRSGRTARGVASGPAKVTALVTKRDKVLANAIEKAVRQGHPLDGLSSRKSDYLPGGRLNTGGATSKKEGANNKRRPKSGPRWEQSKKGTKKPKPRDTTARKRGRS